MPVYTYRCDNCGHEFDKRQSFSEQPLRVCPNCGKHQLQKVYFPAGVAFKGSGFYVTDRHKSSLSSNGKPSKGKENGAKESGTKETKVEKKSETPAAEPSKPAAKKES